MTRAYSGIQIEGPWQCLRCQVTGTHKSDFMGIAPTGNRIDLPSVLLFRLNNKGQVDVRQLWQGLRIHRGRPCVLSLTKEHASHLLSAWRCTWTGRHSCRSSLPDPFTRSNVRGFSARLWPCGTICASGSKSCCRVMRKHKASRILSSRVERLSSNNYTPRRVLPACLLLVRVRPAD